MTARPALVRRLALPAVAFALACAACGGGEPARDGKDAGEAPAGAGPETRIFGEERAVEVAGARLYTRALGEGPAVLVVHGGPGLDQSYFFPGLEGLTGHARLIFYDQRALGRSSGAPDSAQVSLDGFLRDLDAVRAAYGLDRTVVLGHSWGALLAVLYAATRPDRVRGLILMSPVEPGRRYQAQTVARHAARRTARDSAALDSLLRSPAFGRRDSATLNRIFQISFRTSFADPTKASRLHVAFGTRTVRNGGTVAALLMGPLGAYDFWTQLERIRTPTLLLHGDADPIPMEMVREMEERLPDARLVVIPDAGHFPWVERPEPVFRAIEEFLAGLP